MTAAHRTKFVHEGVYVAEMEVHLMDSTEGWGPYLSVEEAEKLDEVREALRSGDLVKAKRLARVYRMTPVNES
jgi:hypothetical protein